MGTHKKSSFLRQTKQKSQTRRSVRSLSSSFIKNEVPTSLRFPASYLFRLRQALQKWSNARVHERPLRPQICRWLEQRLRHLQNSRVEHSIGLRRGESSRVLRSHSRGRELR